MWRYGMKYMGFSLGCQPMDGLREIHPDEMGYKDVLIYDRPLTDREIYEHELVFLGECDG